SASPASRKISAGNGTGTSFVKPAAMAPANPLRCTTASLVMCASRPARRLDAYADSARKTLGLKRSTLYASKRVACGVDADRRRSAHAVHSITSSGEGAPHTIVPDKRPCDAKNESHDRPTKYLPRGSGASDASVTARSSNAEVTAPAYAHTAERTASSSSRRAALKRLTAAAATRPCG